MKSPLSFKDSVCISEYTPERDAEFTAYMDIQLETEELIPFNEEITKYVNEEIFKK